MITSNGKGIYKIVDLSDTKTTNLASTSFEGITIQPPEGFIYKVIMAGFYTGVPSGGASGTHYVLLHSSNSPSTTTFQYYKHTSNFGSALSVLASGYVDIADSNQKPDDGPGQVNSFNNAYATYDNPLYLHYKNLCDVQQDQNRIYTIKVLQITTGV